MQATTRGPCWCHRGRLGAPLARRSLAERAGWVRRVLPVDGVEEREVELEVELLQVGAPGRLLQLVLHPDPHVLNGIEIFPLKILNNCELRNQAVIRLT